MAPWPSPPSTATWLKRSPSTADPVIAVAIGCAAPISSCDGMVPTRTLRCDRPAANCCAGWQHCRWCARSVVDGCRHHAIALSGEITDRCARLRVRRRAFRRLGAKGKRGIESLFLRQRPALGPCGREASSPSAARSPLVIASNSSCSLGERGMASPSRIASAAPNRRAASTRWLRGGQSCQPADAVDDISQVASDLGQREALPKEPNRAVQVAQVGTDGAESDEDARQNQTHLMVVSDLERLLQPRHGQRYRLAARDCRTGLSEGRDADWCLDPLTNESVMVTPTAAAGWHAMVSFPLVAAPDLSPRVGTPAES